MKIFSTKNKDILHQKKDILHQNLKYSTPNIRIFSTKKVKDLAYLEHIHIFHPPSYSKKKTELKKEQASLY